MVKQKYILAIDHGTSGIKSALVTTQGEVLDFESKKTPIHFLPGGGAEQDPDDWWNALILSAKTIVQRQKHITDDIIAICVSSTFSSTVAVDTHGRHLMNSLTWMDSRGAPYVKQVMKGFPSIEGYGLSKILKWIPKTGGGPSLSGKDDIAHVLYIKYEFPEIYDKNLIRYLKVDPEKFPELKKSTDILGIIKKDVADQIGLNHDVKILMGSPDHQCACIGSGAIRDYEAHIYIGTSSWVQCVVPFKKTDPFHSIASFPTAIPGKYQSVNEQDMAGGCLDFLLKQILLYEKREITDNIKENEYKKLDEIANLVPAGSDKLIFTPWLNGERTPVDDIHVRGSIYNISKTTTQPHIVRAFFEGVAYNVKWTLKYLERFIGQKLDMINIVGGGAKSDIWCQIFSDVLNRKIRQVKDPIQANARGAAFIASVGLDHITFNDIPDLIKYKKIYTPNPDNRKIYDILYKEFINIYRCNKGIFKRLNRI